jgi:hypothetical protein
LLRNPHGEEVCATAKAFVEQADALVRRGVARSRNRLIHQAVEEYLKQLEEASIDARFAEMEHDERYCDLSLKLACEFEIPTGKPSG